MKKIILLGLLVNSCCISLYAQTGSLTIEKIMRDPKWIGSSPSGVFWTPDSKSIYFNWNPEKNIADSLYRISPDNKTPVKIKYNQTLSANAIRNGNYNTSYSRLVYEYKGDIYLLDIASNKTTRITRTREAESNPVFAHHNEWVVYTLDDNLYAWDIATGITLQLSAFIKSKAPGKKEEPSQQEQWLKSEQLRTSAILQQRKNKRDLRNEILKANKETDTLHLIYIKDTAIQNIQLSPDARFITYNLYKENDDVKNTVVPAYVTESGFTTDIPGREMVGRPEGRYEQYVYDRIKDTVMLVKTDSLPGITDQPDYVKDYPAKYKDKKKASRDVFVNGLYWNEEGTSCVADIRSLDNKDRWLMQLDAVTGKLKLLDRQRDEAWIGGPGVGWLGAANIGWISEHVFYFQSESTGYSQLYSYNLSNNTKKAVTQGSYEVLEAKLSRNKQYFYLLTNEEHPGKQNWCRIKTDGTQKEKISSMDGGYEISLSPDEKYIAYRYSYQNKPWELYLQENSTGKKPVQITDKAMSDTFRMYPWRDTKIFTFAARDGKPVYARIYEPAAGKKNNAAVIFVHGAGYLQNVEYAWSYYFHEFMFNNLLADKGYTVLDIDYRASAGYGRDWRTGIYRYMGGKDLDDEVDAARYLVKEQGIDAGRIGMYGGSYGGFMTLMALFTQPDVFKAGAALRPVTDWAHYEHSYTSPILNEPVTDSLAYERSSPINFAAGLKNHLLICHGMVDVNVHFQDAVRLNQRLIELGKDNWEIAAYPLEDHGFVEPSSWTDEYRRILKLFDSTLLK